LQSFVVFCAACFRVSTFPRLVFTIGVTAAKMDTNSGDERSRADEFNEVTMEVWEELEAKAAAETLQLALPLEVLDGLKALGEPSSELLHKSVLAQKCRINQLVEEVNLLTENPNTFDWPLKDPLRCFAIGIFREHAKKFADRIHGKFNLSEADNDNKD
jgi:hypothetical protein